MAVGSHIKYKGSVIVKCCAWLCSYQISQDTFMSSCLSGASDAVQRRVGGEGWDLGGVAGGLVGCGV